MVNRKPTFVVAEAAIDTSPKTEIAIEQFVITPLPVKKRAFRALHKCFRLLDVSVRSHQQINFVEMGKIGSRKLAVGAPLGRSVILLAPVF